mmetsp:Transcript_4889/g.13482  ORF Transcript_4889/g.13482 Transcript_4889/m.13482 type:complete len:235 (-) Transcript_4889:947-1651(-)
MVTVKWSSSMCSNGPRPWQWPALGAGCRRPWYKLEKAAVGTARREVPVSTAAVHPPSSQKSSGWLFTRMPRTGTIQWPISGSCTGPQERSSARWPSAQPPRAISLSSSALSARKTPKVLDMPLPLCWRLFAMTPMKLNSGACERPSNPRPRTPSNWNSAKGSSESEVAAIRRKVTQPSSSPCADPATARLVLSSAALGLSTQMTSSTRTPVTSPVPKETAIWSRGSVGLTFWPS